MADERVYAAADLLRFRPGVLPPGLGEPAEPEEKQNSLGYKVKEVQCVLPAKPPLKPGRQKAAKTTTRRKDKVRGDPGGVQASEISTCKDAGSLRILLWQLASATKSMEADGGFEHCGVRLLIEMETLTERIREIIFLQRGRQAAISIQKGWRDLQESRKLAALKELERLEAQRGSPLPLFPVPVAAWWPEAPAAAPSLPSNASDLLSQLKQGAAPAPLPPPPQQPPQQLDGRSLLQMLSTSPSQRPQPEPAPAPGCLDGRALLQQLKPQAPAPSLDGRALLQQLKGPLAPAFPAPAVPPILGEPEASQARTFDPHSFFRKAELAQQGAAAYPMQQARGSNAPDPLGEFIRAAQAQQSQGQRDQHDAPAARPAVPDPPPIPPPSQPPSQPPAQPLSREEERKALREKMRALAEARKQAESTGVPAEGRGNLQRLREPPA